jgi:transcriptional regulator with XRE-family HTH domain
MTNISKWLHQKFLEWESLHGKRMSISGFAKHIDVPQPSLSNWMAGHHEPTGENLFKIASVLGDDVYDVLGESRRFSVISDLDLYCIVKKWDNLPDEIKTEIKRLVDVKEGLG